MSAQAILVTGGAGYVGAHICKALRAAGFVPVVLDNLSTGHRSFVRWGPLVHADIRDAGAVGAAIRQYDIEALVHCAANAYVGESVEYPRKYYENNVGGSLATLQAMLEEGCHKIVFSSSCAIYGEPGEIPIRETAPHDPLNPYGATKAMVERILSDYSAAFGLRSISLRYFNAAGADPEADLGEMREPETHLIPRAMMAMQGHIPDFAVFGGNYPTPDGTAIRDYVHVSDLADSHVVSVRRLLEGGEGGAFNLGTGRGHSVKQVLDAIAIETGNSVRTAMAPRREGDPAELVADPSLARAVLGFAPTCSDLTTIIRTAWTWHQRAHPKRSSSLTEPQPID